MKLCFITFRAECDCAAQAAGGRVRRGVQSADCIAAPVGAKKLSKLGVRAPLCCQVFLPSLGVCTLSTPLPLSPPPLVLSPTGHNS